MDWFTEDVVLAIHEAQIAEHGGTPGLRDRGFLLSALARPQNAALYSDADVPMLADLYALGIIKNHPFLDGNKRVGAVLVDAFLDLHGLELTAIDAEFAAAIIGVAGGSLSEEAFIAWVRDNIAG
ncbi:MAG: type II toxin-antitoxin system death-on-curing family toxin [Vulcanimicrobiaceae bacterium]